MKSNSPTIHTIAIPNYNEFGTHWLLNKLKELQTQKNKICIALSGGTTPIPILSNLKDYDLEWKKYVFFMVDERIVELNSPQSNYGNINKAFFKHIPSKSYSMVLNRNHTNKSITEYQKILKNEVEHSNCFPAFDLILLGMGDDGHVASLFPKTEALYETTESVVKNYIPKLKSDRITLTYPVLTNAQEVAIMIKGNSKKVIFDELTSSQKTTYPVSKITKSGVKLTWLIGI